MQGSVPRGAVPEAWPSVLLLALLARPGAAIAGLGWLLIGRRVRGWNELCLAAAAHHNAYRWWIARAEPAILSRYTRNTSPAAFRVDAVILGAASNPVAAAATRDSLRAAFGAEMAIWVAADALAGCRTLPGNDTPAAVAVALRVAGGGQWILPIEVGDLVASQLGSLLGERLDDAADLLYWDEDRSGGAGRRANPWVKPDWDPRLFGARDGLTGSCLFRFARGDGLTGAGEALGWPQFLYDSARHSPIAPSHLPLILTHRAAEPRRFAAPAPVQRAASVSVIVPTRDRADLLEVCLEGLAETQFPGERDIIIVDNGSIEARTIALFHKLGQAGAARIVACGGPFNFAALANAGVHAARKDLVCLLNNDIEVRDPSWLAPMAAYAAEPDVGAVGARLLFPDGSIQHAGVALGIGDAAGHVEKGVVPEAEDSSPWYAIDRTVSAVTGACLVVSREKFLAVGGMDSAAFAVDFNDVDLCLRLAERSWKTVYCASAVLVHHESKSRGRRRTGPDQARFERELANLRARWHTDRIVDPYHSPLFRRQVERCLLAF